ncbi:hypothetical protein [uncultured Thiodictyon sp.]|uniref:hypothetical protein n=1 Tax=uncultured Thiodictyon sp. TaxID=1846217 RepID=UPI0025FDF507|nr:hypothetical protein [uncultured Thiodictyon sp.]
MSNATLVILITAVILAQAAIIGLFGWLRQRGRLRTLERSDLGNRTLVGASPPQLDITPPPAPRKPT